MARTGARIQWLLIVVVIGLVVGTFLLIGGDGGGGVGGIGGHG